MALGRQVADSDIAALMEFGDNESAVFGEPQMIDDFLPGVPRSLKGLEWKESLVPIEVRICLDRQKHLPQQFHIALHVMCPI